MHFTRDVTLPKLAWAAHTAMDGNVTTAIAGEWVDSGPNYLLEGAWNGDFSRAEFRDSYSFMGSGLEITGDSVIAVTACNTLEALYSIVDDRGFFVSNSFALLLEVTDRKIDPKYLDYEADALSISAGVENYNRWIPLADSHYARVHYFCNIEWSRESGLIEHAKKTPPTPDDFAEYRQFLSHESVGISKNATDARRRASFPPIVFCSTGYDSAACAVLGKEMGSDEAVVYESKRGRRTDAGTQVVDALGYSKVHRKDELEFKDTDAAHLFMGSGEIATSFFFSSAADQLEGKTLLSGSHGGMMWNRYLKEEPGQQLLRSFYADTSRKEFRLHVGFILFAPAFLTATLQPEVHRIANAPEMRPWQLDNDYDRPIPRRIAEEAGVPRTAFGMDKTGGVGTSLRFGNLAYVKRTVPPKSLTKFEPFWNDFKKQRPKNAKWLTRSGIYLAFVASTLLERKGYNQLSRLIRLNQWPTKFKCSPFAPSGLFPWSVDELRQTSYRDKVFTRASTSEHMGQL